MLTRCAYSQSPQIPNLLQGLQNPESRIGASIALAKVGKPAVQPLIELLDADDADTKLWAAYTLGKIGPDALPALRSLAKLTANADPELRAAVARTLGNTGISNEVPPAERKQAVAALGKLLQDKSPGVQRNALVALHQLGYFEKEFRVLVDELDHSDTRATTRKVLRESPANFAKLAEGYATFENKFDVWLVLSQLNHEELARRKLQPPTLIELKKVLDDDNRTLNEKEFAAAVVLKHGKRGCELLINYFSNDKLSDVAVQPFRSADPDAVPLLINALKNQEPLVRASAANSLEIMGPSASASVPALIDRLADEDKNVRYRVVRSLHEMGVHAKTAITGLKQIILNPRELEPTRQWALKTLIVTLPETHKEVVNALIEASNEKQNYGVSSLAKQLLKKIDPDAAKAAGIK